MRIDAYQQIQQMYAAKHTHKPAKKNKTGMQDQLQISSKGQDIQLVKNALDGTGDVREDKIAALKAKLEAGTYKVKPEAFADHLLERCEKLQVGSF